MTVDSLFDAMDLAVDVAREDRSHSLADGQFWFRRLAREHAVSCETFEAFQALYSEWHAHHAAIVATRRDEAHGSNGHDRSHRPFHRNDRRR